MKLLIVEDNKDLASNLGDFLELQGHIVDFAENGTTGLELASTTEFDIIILDIMLPGMNGFEVCQQLRTVAKKATPVLMLTAKDTVEDKLLGFDCGADDYLVKPFALRELNARLIALKRRASNAIVDGILRVADLELHLGTLTVTRNGTNLKLTPLETKILEILMKKSPNLVTREFLEIEIWGDLPPDSDTLRTHIHGLRTAIDKNYDTKLLHTVRGMGFRIADS
ncbi:MAG: response regulator transcription factor [Gammaproteobacteria bacterium]|jgi:DNA-binding response OmpR family regulator